MTPNVKPLVAGNWKMNGLMQSLSEIEKIGKAYRSDLSQIVDTLICPPATLIDTAVRTALDTGLQIGAQDCHAAAFGANTGEVSAEMIADVRAKAVIVGHSERRTDNHESNEVVLAKAQAGLRNGLMTIVCIGESEAQRKAGHTLDVLGEQLAGSLPDELEGAELVIAYEPVWAIGTGLVPSVGDIEEAHQFIRENLIARYGVCGATIKILYGGSVKPTNAVELMSIINVDGALVGGASLKADDFLGICAAYQQIA